MSFQKPRGTMDWYGDKLVKFNHVCQILKVIADLYCIEEIMTPTFEHLELFNKSVGETSDVVSKELYSFTDKGNRNISLRPEGTAGVVRAYVENKMYANTNQVKKLYYLMNLFRYERPQGGRLREFHQFGVEYLDVKNPLTDVEIIVLANNILSLFNLDNQVSLRINNLGKPEQRKLWIQDLVQYFENYKDQLSEDSQKRLYKNPLRILDDKIDSQKDFVKNAPKLNKYLTESDKEYFKIIKQSLDILNIKYIVDESLVRGLDYYTGLVFEFVSNDPNLVGKSTIIGGGRYSELIKQTGGPDYEGIGFGMGIERLLIALESNHYNFKLTNDLDVYIGCDNIDTSLLGLSISIALRNYGLKTNIELGDYKKDKNAKNAIKLNAKYFIWIPNELATNNLVIVEDLKTNQKQEVKVNELKQFFFKK